MRLILAAGLVLSALAVPAEARAASDYDAAVAAYRAGDSAGAERLLDRWLAVHPGDADALVQRGYVRLALGRPHRAAEDFRAALRIAPDYADARSGLARAEAPSAEPRASRGFLLAEGAWSARTGGAGDWQEAAIEAYAPVSATASAGARADWYRRFGREDVELTASLGWHPTDRLWLRAGAGGTPQADFRPQVEVSGGADYRVAGGPAATVLTLDASYQRFPLQDVVTIQPSVVQYFVGGKAWLTLRAIGTIADGGKLEAGAMGRIDYAPHEGVRWFAGAANGPDTDLGVVTRVTSLFGGAQLPIGGRLSLTPSLLHEWRDTGAERTEVRLGLRLGF